MIALARPWIVDAPPSIWLLIVVAGTVDIVISRTLYYVALRRLPMSLHAIILTLSPVVTLLWAYWTTLADMRQTWATDPRYSHGYLVPVFALILLWLRRSRLQLDALNPSWWGLPLLALALALRLGGAHYGYAFFVAAP